MKSLLNRPQLEALEDRMMPSATTFSEVDAPNGQFVEKLYVDSYHHLMWARGNYFNAGTPVPGTQNWAAWDVKGVYDAYGNTEIFVNGTNGHLWGLTHYANGAWSSWTDFRASFSAFDAVADGPQVVVAGIDANHVLWQIAGNAGGRWGNYFAPGGTSFKFLDISLWAEYGHDGEAPGRYTQPLDIYAIGQDHHVWWGHEPQARGTSAWNNVGGYFDHLATDQEAIFGGHSQPYIKAWSGNAATSTIYSNWLTSNGTWYGWEAQ
jgi:hypothetical protein